MIVMLNKGNSAGLWKVVNEATNRKPKATTYPDFVETRTAGGDLEKNKK